MSSSSLGRGQSSPIGVILIIGLTLTAAVGIVVVGGDVIERTQSESELGQAQQAMTQFDARAAQVALGDSDSQTIPLGGQGGQYTVKEDVGRVRILHENWNGTECGNCGDYSGSDTEHAGNTTIIYNRTLGAVVYESGDTTMAYQGGGVWRQGPDGDARMVSSPEFHYRDATLTFPLVRVEGSGAASGQASANVQRVETARDIYPNRSETYPDGETGILNPVDSGNITVNVTSDYCEGWREYFSERTEGDVSECSDGTVSADIVTLGVQGEFDPTGGSEIPMRGQDPGHTMDNLFLNLSTSMSNSRFNNFEWSMSGEDGETELEVVLSKQGGGSNCDDPVRAVIYFSEDGGDNYHTWVLDGSNGEDPFRITCPDGDEEVLNVNLLNSSREWKYMDKENNELREHTDNNEFNGSENFTQHASTDPIGAYDTGDKESVEMVVQHYFALLGDVDLKFKEKQAGGKGGNPASLSDASSGDIRYVGGGNVITYLHVTENRVQVELSG